MVFLMTNTWCLKHVEDTKNWIKTLIWKAHICWFTLHNCITMLQHKIEAVISHSRNHDSVHHSHQRNISSYKWMCQNHYSMHLFYNLILSGVKFDLGGAVLSASLYTNSALNGPLSFNEIQCLLAILNWSNQANLWFTINNVLLLENKFKIWRVKYFYSRPQKQRTR